MAKSKQAKSTFVAVGQMGPKKRDVTVRGGAIRSGDGNVVGILNVEGLTRRKGPLRLPYFYSVGNASLRSVYTMGVNNLRSYGFVGTVTNEQTGKETVIEASRKDVGPFRWAGSARVDARSGANEFQWGTWRVMQGRPGGGLWLHPKYGNVDIVSLDGNGFVRGVLTPDQMVVPKYIQVPFRFDLSPVGVSERDWCDLMEEGLKTLTTGRGPSFVKQAVKRRPALPGVAEKGPKKVEGNPAKQRLYRVTFNDPYMPGSPGHDDPRQRQWHVVMAGDHLSAIERIVTEKSKGTRDPGSWMFQQADRGMMVQTEDGGPWYEFVRGASVLSQGHGWAWSKVNTKKGYRHVRDWHPWSDHPDIKGKRHRQSRSSSRRTLPTRRKKNPKHTIGKFLKDL